MVLMLISDCLCLMKQIMAHMKERGLESNTSIQFRNYALSILLSHMAVNPTPDVSGVFALYKAMDPDKLPVVVDSANVLNVLYHADFSKIKHIAWDLKLFNIVFSVCQGFNQIYVAIIRKSKATRKKPKTKSLQNGIGGAASG